MTCVKFLSGKSVDGGGKSYSTLRSRIGKREGIRFIWWMIVNALNK
jgi:hypothetical protein